MSDPEDAVTDLVGMLMDITEKLGEYTRRGLNLAYGSGEIPKARFGIEDILVWDHLVNCERLRGSPQRAMRKFIEVGEQPNHLSLGEEDFSDDVHDFLNNHGLLFPLCEYCGEPISDDDPRCDDDDHEHDSIVHDDCCNEQTSGD